MTHRGIVFVISFVAAFATIVAFWQNTINIVPVNNTIRTARAVAALRPRSQTTWHTIFTSHHGAWHAYDEPSPYNYELEYYDPRNIKFTRRGFVITIKKQAKDGMAYTSARITTRGLFAFEYGKITVIARYPVGKGIWPAIWLRPATNKLYPEIDMAEYLGQTPTTMYEVLHTTAGGHVINLDHAAHGVNFSQHFVTYTLIWTPNLLQWQINHVVTFQITQHVPRQPMFLVANAAVGGSWPGPPFHVAFPQQFIIQSLVVQQFK